MELSCYDSVINIAIVKKAVFMKMLQTDTAIF